MPLFPSRAWMEAFGDALAAHPEGGNMAEALDGTYRFVVEPAGPLEERHTYDVAVHPDGQGAAEVGVVDEVEKPTLHLTADHERWRQLLEGRLDVGMAVMTRRLKVKGELGRLRGRLDGTKPLMEALRSVDTQWLDE